MVKGDILKNRIDNFGRLKVDENLRMKGHRNIFAVGDITDIKVRTKLHISYFLKMYHFCSEESCMCYKIGERSAYTL